MTQKNNGKIIAGIGLLAGVAFASIKGIRHHEYEVAHGMAANPFRLSRSELKTVFSETIKTVGAKNLPTLSAGVAYFSILALFPMMAASVAIAALLISQSQLEHLISVLNAYLPPDIAELISSQLYSLVSRRSENILTAIIAIAVALFSASGASKNLVIASNVAYSVRESRGWLVQQAWGVLWIVTAVGFGFLLTVLLAANNAFFSFLGLPAYLIEAVNFGRWAVILFVMIFGLSVFYRYGPNRRHVRWQWVNWGALFATLVWVVATALFFGYAQNFANYNQSYSIFASIVVLMIWMNLSALIIMLGAVFNHQLELISGE